MDASSCCRKLEGLPVAFIGKPTPKGNCALRASFASLSNTINVHKCGVVFVYVLFLNIKNQCFQLLCIVRNN